MTARAISRTLDVLRCLLLFLSCVGWVSVPSDMIVSIVGCVLSLECPGCLWREVHDI